MITIGKEKKRIDWNAVRAEYIGGGTSYRQLAEKYGTSKDVIARRAKAESWDKARATARDRAATRSIQKTADAAADNATLAASIKRKLLQKLNRIVEALPEEEDATEIREGSPMIRQKILRLKDIASMYKDLTADMPTGQQEENALLRSLMEMEQEARHD